MLYFGGERAVFMLSSQYTINKRGETRQEYQKPLFISLHLSEVKIKSFKPQRLPVTFKVYHERQTLFQILSKKSLKRCIHFGADMIIS